MKLLFVNDCINNNHYIEWLNKRIPNMTPEQFDQRSEILSLEYAEKHHVLFAKMIVNNQDCYVFYPPMFSGCKTTDNIVFP